MPSRLAQHVPSFYEQATGLIDIGSNSVRMVVYHKPVRVPLPLYNEKYFCALGKHLARTGYLNAEGVAEAERCIAEFITTARLLRVRTLEILATAAVRDAADGKDFIRRIEQKHGVKVAVISGETEAQLAAHGVLASIHQPQGLVADLGGGSMELALVNRDHVGAHTTMPVGPLRLLDESDGDPDKMRKLIDRWLAQVPWLGAGRLPHLYAVGGSFRAIAKCHMELTHYPLPILHEYKIPTKALMKFLRKIRAMSLEEISRLPALSSKRLSTIQPAAILFEALVRAAEVDDVVFSVSGIREGHLFLALPKKVREEDALLSSCADLALLADRKGTYAKELFDWMQPLFPAESEQQARLRFGACMLSELAWTINPKFRAEWVYARVIQSSIKGLDHRERVALALALYSRYCLKWKVEYEEFALIDEPLRLWAKQVGTAASLAFMVSAGIAGNLKHSQLSVVGGKVELAMDPQIQALRSAFTDKRLDALGATFRALSSFVI